MSLNDVGRQGPPAAQGAERRAKVEPPCFAVCYDKSRQRWTPDAKGIETSQFGFAVCFVDDGLSTKQICIILRTKVACSNKPEVEANLESKYEVSPR